MHKSAETNSITGAGKRPATVTLRAHETGFVEKSREASRRLFESINQHIPRRLKLIAKRLTQPRVLITALVLFVITFAAGAYYYSKLAREIDERLSGGFFDNSFGIFATPFKVTVGDRLSVDDLAGYLKGASYRQTEGDVIDNLAGSFAIADGSIEVRPGRHARNEFGLSEVKIKIDSTGRVASIKNLSTGDSAQFTTIEGELLAGVRNGDRHKQTPVLFSDIPDNLRNAIIAIEDRRFFSHNGIDWRGITRALWRDINQGSIVQGGSTITQQLIKNAFLSSERTFTRKVKEAAMAIILESRLSKEDIFTLYCNNVYLGQNGSFAVRGFAQASEVYFGKPLSELTIAESAFLAGLIHAPNRYGIDDMARAVERRNIVLDSMLETGAISTEQAQSAKGEQISLKKHEGVNDYGVSYFIDYVQRFLDDRYGEDGQKGSMRVYTTMDPRLQRVAYESITSHTARLDKIVGRAVKKGEAPAQVQAALIALDAHTGEILAMVGGRDYNQSQLNRAYQAMRQPGSTFKPFVYASALSMRSYTMASVLSDTPQTFTYDGGRQEYKPANFHNGYSNRDVSVREAMARSLNVPTVELAMKVGLSNIANLAENCGLERPRAYPSMALGTSEVSPLQLAGAYTAFANNGTALRPTPVKNFKSGDRHSIAQKVSASSAQVFSPQVAYLMTNLMQSVVSAGTASRLNAMGIKGAIAGKTGTANDAWFVGYTPNLICVVWVGYDDNRDLKMEAADAALPIWADFMKDAIEIHPEFGGESFARPAGITSAEIDPTTGLLAGEDCFERKQEIFISGTEPFGVCSHYDFYDEGFVAEYDEELTSPNYYEEARSEGKIEVSVCAETGLVASSTCSTVVRKTFNIGQEPWRTCWGERHKDPDENWGAGGEAEIVGIQGSDAKKDRATKAAKKKKVY